MESYGCVKGKIYRNVQPEPLPKPPSELKMQKCRICGEWKPFSMYHTNTGGKLRTECKKCSSKQALGSYLRRKANSAEKSPDVLEGVV